MIVSVIAIAVASLTVIFAWRGVREMVAGQRAQTGPFLKIRFGEQPFDSSLIDPPHTNLDFLPVRRRNYDDLIIGELHAGSPQGAAEESDPLSTHLIVHLENIQSHHSGIASDIKIELIGWWVPVTEHGDKKGRFIHLRHSSEVLNPEDKRKLNALPIGEVSGFKVEVRRLTYRDIWGHSCRAFSGDKGAVYLAVPGRVRFSTWESAVSDIPKIIAIPHKDYWVWLVRDKLVSLWSFFVRR